VFLPHRRETPRISSVAEAADMAGSSSDLIDRQAFA
jgi:hypothetical protein